MRILSLFDGMACGMIAFRGLGIEVESYDAYEIDKYATQTATHNFPIIQEHGDVFAEDFTKYEGTVDWLIGGSPCTYWSIAQTKNRETVASGMGWELFSQYVRALHEAKPKYFLYENNKSMSKAIRQSICDTFGFEPILINSALVSAQNRQRLYWVGIRQDDGTYRKADIPQPDDRGILLKDILETGHSFGDKSYTMTSSYFKVGTAEDETAHNMERHQRTMVVEAVRLPEYGNNEKSRPVESTYPKHSGTGEGSLEGRLFDNRPYKQQVDLIAEPCCLRYERTEEGKAIRKQYEAHEIEAGYNEHKNLQQRPDGKTNTISTVQKDNMIVEPCRVVQEPCCVAERGRGEGYQQTFEARADGKTNALTSVEKDNRVAEPTNKPTEPSRIGTMPSPDGSIKGGAGNADLFN